MISNHFECLTRNGITFESYLFMNDFFNDGEFRSNRSGTTKLHNPNPL